MDEFRRRVMNYWKVEGNKRQYLQEYVGFLSQNRLLNRIGIENGWNIEKCEQDYKEQMEMLIEY